MGQCISVPHRKLSLMREGSLRKFYKSKTGQLSATFHVLDSDVRWDLLNINTATEEQLMTLPGITRVIAQNIVEYRQTISGFKKVEDLALVSGVGAAKLEHFRNEICVGRRKGPGGSYNSSLNQSLESLQNNDNCSRPSPFKLVCLNTANAFQLMSIRGMTQEMAANILHHRERKGPFKTLDDLLKVKGLPPDRLAIVRLYLTVDNIIGSRESSTVQQKMQDNLCNKQLTSHRRTSSAPCRLSKPTETMTKDLYELISSQVLRPVVKEVFKFSSKGRPAIRIASWNLQKFVLDKAKNPGVKEVICRTVLENGLSLVAVQEIASREALSIITSELNEPQLPNIKNWNGECGKWQSLVPPPTAVACENSHKKTLLNGFLYDTSHGLQLRDSTVLYLPQDKQKGLIVPCQPFLGWFRVENMDFVVVTLSLINQSYVSKLLPLIVDLLKEHIPDEKNVFLLGDFILPPSHTVFEKMRNEGFSLLLPPKCITNLSTNHHESHLWASVEARKLYNGCSGVITEGLSHLAIPKGWQWGGSVSDHCPIWAELYPTTMSPPFTSSPLVNGVRKVSTILEDLESCGQESIINKDQCKQQNGFWQHSLTWKHSHKNSASVKQVENLRENGDA